MTLKIAFLVALALAAVVAGCDSAGTPAKPAGDSGSAVTERAAGADSASTANRGQRDKTPQRSKSHENREANAPQAKHDRDTGRGQGDTPSAAQPPTTGGDVGIKTEPGVAHPGEGDLPDQ